MLDTMAAGSAREVFRSYLTWLNSRRCRNSTIGRRIILPNKKAERSKQ